MRYEISRRALLRGGLGTAAASALAALTAAPASTSSAAASSGRAPAPAGPGAGVAGPSAGRARPAVQPGAGTATDAEIYRVPTINPLVERRADPFITRPVAGMYYLTGSVPEYDRIVVRGAPTLAGLATGAESVIWRRPASGRMGGHVWAPELHRIDNRWYIYFAAGDSDNVFRIRMYVLESGLADPRQASGWVLRGQIATEWDSFSLDATTFAHRGRRYLVWAQSEPEIAVNSSLYIAEMANPWTLAGKPVRITTPTRSWETQGFKVNEGPAVLIRNGRVFLTFSASATDARYCMGLLTASEDANLLDRASWVKTPDPVFVTNEQTRQYGPGHNSFTVAEDGATDVLVYHARDYRDITGDPLYDPNRHARVQKLYWHPDGTPLFGVPVGKGGPIVRLSPADRPTAFIRHRAAAVQVEQDPRELGDTQFRFVTGFTGTGTEAIQPVNLPDHYLRVVDGTARLDPFQDGSAFAGQASFRRLPTDAGILLQVAGDPTLYLRHDNGRLTTGATTDPAATFLRT